MAFSRDDILAVNDRPMKEVPVPVWGDGASVWLRMISAAERDRYFLMTRKGDTFEANPDNFRAKLLVFAICDEEGKRLFADDEAELLGRKCGDAINLLFGEASKINGLTRNDADEVEDARKNS